MQAFVYEAVAPGKDRLGSGRVLGPYQSVRALTRYALRYLPPKTYNVYVYYDWNRRYGVPNRFFQYTVKEQH